MRVITFDGDETLWDFQGAMRRALSLAAGLFDPPVTAEWLSRVRDDVAARPEFAGAPMEDIRRTAFAECARLTGAPEDFADRVHAAYMRARHAGVTLYPDTLPCLRELRSKGHRLALITNGNSRPDLVGVAEFLACTVVAAECGHRKPDPEIYRYAASRLGVPPGECVHVGDHPVEDVDASAEAGMRAVWLDRVRGLERPRRAWLRIDSLAELPGLL
ncbi:HAD family hydrolase [Herbidospora sp. NBRC 101105]|uniref:HAD family hydrolase n=1 Tax=Herbidospora sp. NBRC 101105 TaxID=3032195 RepID=UPI0024A24D2A|nr:HAD family hydrolase [Herbidospora sp. NBRC 101105]GLX97949.1 hydrolase [Herbidospora sp. NBRC 101105]